MISPLQSGDALLADIHRADGSALHVWWLGQSGFLFKQGGAYLLIDPYLSDSLTRKYAATDKPHIRMTERCIEPAALSFVPLVASSHQHTDHFDEATLNALGPIDLIVPAAMREASSRRLGDASQAALHDLDAGITVNLHGWQITGVASAHNDLTTDDQGRHHYLGFVVQRAGFTVYHSGDTLVHPGLVPALQPLQCDLMLLPINGNKPERRVSGNMDGPEAAQLAKDCATALVVPHHFEMFTFNTAAPDDFIVACRSLKQPHQVMRCGERLTLTRTA